MQTITKVKTTYSSFGGPEGIALLEASLKGTDHFKKSILWNRFLDQINSFFLSSSGQPYSKASSPRSWRKKSHIELGKDTRGAGVTLSSSNERRKRRKGAEKRLYLEAKKPPRTLPPCHSYQTWVISLIMRRVGMTRRRVRNERKRRLP